MCDKCFLKYMARTIKQIANMQKWTFDFVGNCEQGGYVCPVCRNNINPYSFDGKCGKCGFEESNWVRFK